MVGAWGLEPRPLPRHNAVIMLECAILTRQWNWHCCKLLFIYGKKDVKGRFPFCSSGGAAVIASPNRFRAAPSLSVPAMSFQCRIISPRISLAWSMPRIRTPLISSTPPEIENLRLTSIRDEDARRLDVDRGDVLVVERGRSLGSPLETAKG